MKEGSNFNDCLLLDGLDNTLSCKFINLKITGLKKMGKIIKWLFYFTTMGALALVFFSYIGPFLGFDLSPDEKTIMIPVELHEN